MTEIVAFPKSSRGLLCTAADEDGCHLVVMLQAESVEGAEVKGVKGFLGAFASLMSRPANAEMNAFRAWADANWDGRMYYTERHEDGRRGLNVYNATERQIASLIEQPFVATVSHRDAPDRKDATITRLPITKTDLDA